MDCSLLGTKHARTTEEKKEKGTSKRTEAQLFSVHFKLLLLLLFGGYVIAVVVDSIFLGVKEFFIN